jgi:hypothetical protein
MDACTYESITGRKDYYGFKSVLKNGTATNRFGCDDETIVFNRVQTWTETEFKIFGYMPFELQTNQVAVVVACSTPLQMFDTFDMFGNYHVYSAMPTFTTFTVNGWQHTFDETSLNVICTNQISIGAMPPLWNFAVSFAIFDLF